MPSTIPVFGNPVEIAIDRLSYLDASEQSQFGRNWTVIRVALNQILCRLIPIYGFEFVGTIQGSDEDHISSLVADVVDENGTQGEDECRTNHETNQQTSHDFTLLS
jgi:hypothetical protein